MGTFDRNWVRRAALLLLGGTLTAAGGAAADPPAPAQPADQTNPSIEEVVVTARKRSEGLEQTPLAITALTQQRLEQFGVHDLSEAARFVPNLSFRKSGGFAGGSAATEIFIRGAGQSDFILPADPGVGVYLDGVYMARTVGAALDLADVDRVEVLRGPQGTLFGRNAIGGAINVITKQPDPQFGSYASVTAGENDNYGFKGSINVPITEQLSWRASAQRRVRGGYVKLLQYNDLDAGDENVVAWRQQLRYQRDRLTSGLAVDYSKEEEHGGPWVADKIIATGADPNGDFLFASAHNQDPNVPADCATANGQRTDRACYGPVWETGSHFKSNNAFYASNGDGPKQIDPKNSTQNFGTSWNTEYELTPAVTLKSISAYRNLHASFIRSLAHAPITIFSSNTPLFQSNQWSQELQLGGRKDRLEWVTGLYAFREEGLQQIDQDTSLYTRPDSSIDVTNVSLASFASGTLHLTDQLDFTLGGRLTNDRKSGKLNVPNFFDPIASQPDPTFLPASRRSTAFTPSANLAYRVTPDVMTYFSYADGYKNGSFAVRLPLPNQLDKLATSKPEYLTMYEIGVKSDLLDHRLRVNLALFDQEYDDIQITYEPVGLPPLVGNAGTARSRGLELEVQALATDHLQLSGAFSVLSAHYTKLDPQPTPFWSKNTPMPRSPRYQVTLGANYTVPLPVGSLVLGADWQWVAREALDPETAGFPYAIGSAWNSGNASIGFMAPSEKWGITLHVENVTDEAHKISVLDASRDTWGVAEAVYNRPREAYVTLDYRF